MSNARQTADAIKGMRADPLSHSVREGLIKDVDKKTGLVKVELQPEGVVTGWIRYKGLGMSMGKWRGMALPELESEVLLLSRDPDGKSYVALGGLFNEEDAPPADYALGTLLFEHEGGNLLLLDQDGMVYLGGKAEAHPVVLETWIKDTFNSLVSAFNSHTHSHPYGPTLVPVSPAQPWASGGVSTKFKGE